MISILPEKGETVSFAPATGQAPGVETVVTVRCFNFHSLHTTHPPISVLPSQKHPLKKAKPYAARLVLQSPPSAILAKSLMALSHVVPLKSVSRNTKATNHAMDSAKSIGKCLKV